MRSNPPFYKNKIDTVSEGNSKSKNNYILYNIINYIIYNWLITRKKYLTSYKCWESMENMIRIIFSFLYHEICFFDNILMKVNEWLIRLKFIWYTYKDTAGFDSTIKRSYPRSISWQNKIKIWIILNHRSNCIK